MKVPQKLWRETKIEKVLHLFPGQLGELLQKTGGLAAIERAKKFLPFIFYRWYFLEIDPDDGMTPYLWLDFCREVEKWPKEGQFYPHLTISKKEKSATNNEMAVEIEVDYISFERQPFLLDLNNLWQGKSVQYQFGPEYTKDLRKTLNEVTKTQKPDEPYQNVIHLYLDKNLQYWWAEDPYIREAFAAPRWKDLWREILLKAGTDEGLSISAIQDRFVDELRKYDPDFGIDSEELREQADEPFNSADLPTTQMFIFWMKMSHYLLVPLSVYWQLLAPVFIDHENFKKDITDLLKYDCRNLMPIYSPCTHLYLTPFGKRVFGKK